MMSQLKNTILAALIALVVGVGIGYTARSKFERANKLDAAVKAERQTAKDIQQSLETSAAIDNKTAASSTGVEKIRTVTVERIIQRENEYAESAQASCHVVNPFLLDVGTVGLLNAARAGEDFDTSRLGDEESLAPSGIALHEFVSNDLEVVKMYHDLAIRHDALVDYVESVINEQAK